MKATLKMASATLLANYSTLMGIFISANTKISIKMALARWLTSQVILMKAIGKMTVKMAKEDCIKYLLLERCLDFMLENFKKTNVVAKAGNMIL